MNAPRTLVLLSLNVLAGPLLVECACMPVHSVHSAGTVTVILSPPSLLGAQGSECA